MHRNTFIDSPRLLDGTFNLKSDKRIFFAGQITGVEGYIESAASGILAGLAMVAKLDGKQITAPPVDTMLGALCNYISSEEIVDFQPMGCNMGILPPLLEIVKGKEPRYTALAERAIASMKEYAQTIL